jgi:PAS domain S-box-containing protein
VQPRHIARVVLALALIVAGSIVARVLADRELQHDSDRRAEVAAAQIQGRIVQAASFTESLRRFMLDARTTGVTSDQFATNALRWLGPAGFSAAGWVEQIRRSRRAAYERRIGQPIVTPELRFGVVPIGPRPSYLPATLVTGFPPMAVPGIDLRNEPGMAAALSRATRLDRVVATPMASPRIGPRGLFLVAPAPNLIGEVLRPGYVTVFVSDLGLRAAATGVPAVQVWTVGGSPPARSRGGTSTTSFTAAAQRFTVVVPREPLQGAAAALPWVILGGGLLVVGLGAALGLNAVRRARAQKELDRIFTLSQDLIAVADFDGRFTRVNPATEEILGYSEEELLARPYIGLVHPADRDGTSAEADAIAHGKPTVSFENRYIRKDGSIRVLDWTTTADIENGLMYAVARDVTERRNAEAEVKRLADAQTALRRVATLVAKEAPPAEVFAKVAEEAAMVLGDADCALLRDEGDGTGTVVGLWSGRADEFRGSRLPIDGDSAIMVAIREARPTRVGDYSAITSDLAPRAVDLGMRDGLACPIVVRGRVWGAIGVVRYGGAEPFATDAEERLAQFADLVATAVANADARGEIERLAEEQAALRRVATLVAEGASPTAVFDAAAAELGALLHAHGVSLCRYEAGDELTVVAHRGPEAARLPPGTRVRHDSKSVTAMVRRTQRPARLDSYAETGGTIGDLIGRLKFSAGVGAPIVVEGRLWGVTVANWTGAERPPPDTEQRMAEFTELLDAAIANADSRDQLTASRARLLTEADEARQRVVRDLHDGAQQRLVHTILTLKLAQRALRSGRVDAGSRVDEALAHAERSNNELRELAHGIHPLALTAGGLRGAVRTLVQRIDLPVDVDVLDERLPPEIEASAYFIIAEALTNVLKHSQAAHADVTASVRNGMAHVQVRDDGTGGADPDGHGLVGMKDRVAALGGRFEIASPPGGGTCIAATLPLGQAGFADSP